MSTKGVSAIMTLLNRSRRLVVLAGALALLSVAQPAAAQDIADSHLAAARGAIAALRATEEFDFILPQAAQALKAELIQKNPDMQAMIIEVVDQTAFALAARRGDLEREAALAYARVFSEQELNEVAAFYQSGAGTKLLDQGAVLVREVMQAADIWQNGIARDLARQAAEELSRRDAAAAAEQDASGGDADADGSTETPAE